MTTVMHIKARNLSKHYGEECVVNDLSFDVPKGQCVGLLGPNGAGKTTTIKMILGQAQVSSGELSVFGLPVQQNTLAIRQRCGVVPQMDNLDPDFTVEENLQVYASFFGLKKQQIAERIDYLLEFAKLQNRAKYKVSQLSGGMLRRLSIARALINNPDLVVLDEPTTGLDPQVRHLIWERVHDLKKDGKTILLTTHYMDEAERLCDQIWVIDHGKVLSQGSPKQLIKQHVEANVVEIREYLPQLLEQLRELNAGRIEEIGGTIYCYSDNVQPFIEALYEQNIAYISRPSNLEDVFLSITGRDLRD